VGTPTDGARPADREAGVRDMAEDGPLPGLHGPEGKAGRPVRERDVAIRALYELHADGLRALAYLLTGERWLAEELVQEAFLVAWKQWSRIRHPDAARAYLRATVVNLARNSLRRRFLELRHRFSATAEPVVENPGQRLDLERALAALPERKRACVVLRHWVGCSEQEAAMLLGVSVGTVKSQTAKGLAQLQDLLGAVGEERDGTR
jgi:RNA polymerase sigma-70 factor (sigma-E family)